MISIRYSNDGNETEKLNQVQRQAKSSLMEKLNNKEYKCETIKCECGSNEFEVLSEKDRYGISVNTVICKKCGLVLINPRMNQESYNSFYDNEYRRLYNGDEEPKESFWNDQYERGKEVNRFIKKYVDDYSKINNVLEIGCGAGGILKNFYEDKCKVTGIDLGDEYIEFGKEKGLNLICCSSKELLENHKKEYNLIILCHVFEHFLNLSDELNIIKELLAPNGIIYIEVPGIKNLHNSYDCDLLEYLQNAHTYNFTLDTLKQIMLWNGFECIYGNEKINSIFKASNVNVCKSINNYYNDNMNYILDLEKNKDAYFEEYSKNHRNYTSFKNKSAFDKVKRTLNQFPDKSVLIYGTGSHTELLCEYLETTPQIRGIVDRDISNVGKNMYGYEILNLENEKNNISSIVISSLSYQEEIYRRIKYLEKYGIKIIKIYE